MCCSARAGRRASRARRDARSRHHLYWPGTGHAMTQRRTTDVSLFAAAGRRAAAERAPLAERLRPRRLDEILGQHELLAAGSLLRREVAARRLGSLLLWGPPGSGKT